MSYQNNNNFKSNSTFEKKREQKYNEKQNHHYERQNGQRDSDRFRNQSNRIEDQETRGKPGQNLLPDQPRQSHEEGFTGSPNQVFDGLNMMMESQTRKEDDPYFSSYDSIHIHQMMIKDKPRTDAYLNAIMNNKHLFKDKIVMDVGCGTGILSIFAARAGAKKVYAIERSDFAEKAEQIIKENDLQDVIQVINKEVESLEKGEIEMVDIIISEWMGYVLLYESMFDSVIDARDKFLKPDGLMFPSKASIHLAAIDDQQFVDNDENFWENNEYGIKMSSISQCKDKFIWVDKVQPYQILTNSSKVFEIDTKTCSIKDLEFANEYELEVWQGGWNFTGFVIWFDVEFHPPNGHKVILSTSPQKDFTHWKHQVVYIQGKQNRKNILPNFSRIHGSFALRKSPKNRRDIQLKISVNNRIWRDTKMTDFKILSELGRGSYGTVYKVISFKNNQICVLKKISLKHMKPKQQQGALKEVQILRFLDHPHIIKYFTSFIEDESIHIVMEYAEKGDLYKLLKEQRQKRKYFSEKDIWDFSYQICMAVEYLHLKNIIHRDIKCLNIFLTEDKMIKIGDLGVSKIVSSSIAQQDTRVGTPLYLSPELVKQQPYDFKVDIWAIGCAIYHLACLEPPFQGDNLITLGNNIVNKKPKALPQIYSNKLSNFIDKFLMKKVSDRPSAREAVLLIPSFVKAAYNDMQLRKNMFKFDDQQLAQQTDSTASQDKNRPISPQKEVRSPTRRQISETQVQVKKSVEPAQVKIENNIPLINFYSQNQHQPSTIRDKIIRKNKELLSDKEEKTPTPSGQNHLPSFDKVSNHMNFNSNKLIGQDNDNSSRNYIKSQSQENIASPKIVSPYVGSKATNNMAQNNNENFEQMARNKVENIQSNRNERYEVNRNSVSALKLNPSSKSSMNFYQNTQLGLQSTKDESKVTNKQNIVQFKIENALDKIQEEQSKILQSSHNEKQQAQNKIIKGEVDMIQLQSKQSDKNQHQLPSSFGKEMPFNARPQTASASTIHQRRSIQQQSVNSGPLNSQSSKPGISLLRNLINKNTQEDAIAQMQQQHIHYRPFSAAMPLVRAISKKKSVNFKDEMTKGDEPSEVEIVDIVNDDEQSQIMEKAQDLRRESFQVKQNDILIRRGIRPNTANIGVKMVVSQQQLQIQNQVRQSFETAKPQDSMSNFKNLNSPDKKKIVAQSLDLSQHKPLIKQNNDKNELNLQNKQAFEQQFSKFYKVNLKRSSALSSIQTEPQNAINDHKLKEKIKNYQPISMPINSSTQESQKNLQVLDSFGTGSQQNLINNNKYQTPKQQEQNYNAQTRYSMNFKSQSAPKQHRKITIRDLNSNNTQQ